MAHLFEAAKLTGLLALVLGAMAFSTTVAQAETGAHWNVDQISFESFGGKLNVEVQSTIEGSFGVLLTKVATVKVEILCTTIRLKDALLKANGGATGKAHFEGCITKINGIAEPACKPHSPGAPEGLIETNVLDALIVLHENKTVDLVQVLPTSGSIFVTVVLGIENPALNECLISIKFGEKFNVTGNFFLKDAQGELLLEKIKHLVIEGPLSALLFSGNAATIDGSSNLFLDGVHKGLTFSGIAA